MLALKSRPNFLTTNQMLPGIIILLSKSPGASGLENEEEKTVEPKEIGRTTNIADKKTKETPACFLEVERIMKGAEIKIELGLTMNIITDETKPEILGRWLI